MPQTTTSVDSATNGWTDLATTIPARGCPLVLTATGMINFGTGSCDAGGAPKILSADPALFNALLSLFPSGYAYALAVLILPVGVAPVNDPAHGGGQYTGGILAPGPGPRSYTLDEVLYVALQSGVGPWKLWGRCNDYGPGDNSGSWGVTTRTPPNVPVITATPGRILNAPEIIVAGS